MNRTPNPGEPSTTERTHKGNVSHLTSTIKDPNVVIVIENVILDIHVYSAFGASRLGHTWFTGLDAAPQTGQCANILDCHGTKSLQPFQSPKSDKHEAQNVKEGSVQSSSTIRARLVPATADL